MASETLDDNIDKHRRFFPADPPTLSVAAWSGWDAEQTARAAAFIPRGQRIRISTVGAIRSLGHNVVPQGQIPHASLQLGAAPSEAMYEELRAVFSEPIRNPRQDD